MSNWKQAYRLATYEMKESLKAFLGIAMLLIIVSILLAISSNSLNLYSKMDAMAFYDFVFIVTFTFMPMWLQMPAFMAGQPSKNGSFAAPGVVCSLQLPILKDVISKSRVIIHVIFGFALQVPLLAILYVASPPVREAMGIGTYCTFSIIWLAFGMFLGSGMAIQTDFSGPISVPKLIVYLLLFFGLAALFYVTFTTIIGSGIVYASITAARKWPILSSILAIVIAACGLHFTHQYNIKLMKRNDYM